MISNLIKYKHTISRAVEKTFKNFVYHTINRTLSAKNILNFVQFIRKYAKHPNNSL